jgi:hypothetical protein
MLAFCRPKLGGIKTQSRQCSSTSFSRSANGKVLIEDIREPSWRGHELRI